MTPTIAQINHDLNLLYIIARSILPKEVLEALLYGSDFTEPDEEDYEVLGQLQQVNRRGVEVQSTVGGRGEEVSVQEPPHWNS